MSLSRVRKEVCADEERQLFNVIEEATVILPQGLIQGWLGKALPHGIRLDHS